MEAPGWDQLVSGEINAPSQLATIANTRAETQLKTAQTQLADTQNQQDQVALDLAQARSPLEKTLIGRAQLAQAFSSVDSYDPDAGEKFDAKMRELAAQGNPDAGQYIGKFNRELQTRMTNAYAADSPLAQLDAMNGGGAAPGAPGGRGGALGAGAGGAPGYSPEQMSVALDQMQPQQIQQAAQKVAAYKAALQAIDSAPPAQQAQVFAQYAAALGHPEWADPSKFSPTALAPLREEVKAWDQALSARGFASGIGAPAPLVPNEVKEAGNTLYSIPPSGKAAVPITPQGTFGLVATNPSGVGVYHNPVTNRETVGTETLDAKPGTQRQTATQWKYQAWLDAHPGDESGALDYAGGRSSHTMGAAQIQVAASAAAGRELNDLTNAGTPPANPQAFLSERTQAYAAQFSAAQAPAAGGAGGGPPVSPAARATGFVDPSAYGDDPMAPARANTRNIWVHQSDMGARGNPAKIAQVAVKLPPMANPGPPPPANVTEAWKPGQLYVTRARGAWTLKDGQPVRVW